jgi:hypothetical protein
MSSFISVSNGSLEVAALMYAPYDGHIRCTINTWINTKEKALACCSCTENIGKR